MYIFPVMKALLFVGSSLGELRAFPVDARREAGHQLDQVQRGRDPDDWKPMKSVGKGVREIRLHVEGEHRVLYVATLGDAVYVLHAFEKKTQKTPQRDIELARKRFRQLGG